MEGYNQECTDSPAFYAAKGWDPVTGLGTPNFPKLFDLFMSLP
jgi:tripeptidyl-peptidase-1